MTRKNLKKIQEFLFKDEDRHKIHVDLDRV